MFHPLEVDGCQARRRVVGDLGAVLAEHGLVVGCGPDRIGQRPARVLAVLKRRQVPYRVPNRDVRQQAVSVGGARPGNRHAQPVAEKEDAAPLLRHSILLGAESMHFDGITEIAQSGKDRLHRLPAADGSDAGDVLHHDPFRHEPFDDPEVLAKQSAAFVVHAALMVVDAERLAGRATDQAVQFAAIESSGMQKITGGNVFDGTGEKPRPGVARDKRLGGVRVDVIAGQDVKTRLAESLGEAARPAEQVDRRPAPFGHSRAGPVGGMVRGS